MKNALVGCLLLTLGLGWGCRQTDAPLPKFNRNMAATPGPDYTPNGQLMPIEAGGSDAAGYLQDPRSPDLKRQAQAAQPGGAPAGTGASSAPASQAVGTEAATPPAAEAPASAPASASAPAPK